MERQTIEESLEVLMGTADSPSRSPLSIKRGRGKRKVTPKKKEEKPPPIEENDSEEDLFEILKSDDSPDSSPRVKEESEEEEEEKSDEEESEEEEEEEEEKSDEEESEEEEEEEKSDEEESEEENVSVTSNKILPITPKRFTVATPRTPSEKLNRIKKKKRPGNFIEHLKEFRYSLLRFLYIDDKLAYVVCYDPYGQIVFVSCDSGVESDLKENISKVDVVKLKTVPEEIDNPLDESFVNAIKECVDMAVFGVIFYNGEDYQICERNSRGYFKDKFCVIKNQKKTDPLRLPQSFIIVKSNDIFEEPLETIESNKSNYENIQRQQLASSKHTFKEIVESMKRLNRIIVDFDKVYQNHSAGLMKDLNVMAKHCNKMYTKYSDQELEEEDKEKFDLLSLNRFLRGQLNIQKSEMMDRLYSIKDHLDKSEMIIETAIGELMEKDENIIGSVVKRDEIDRYI